MWRRLLIFVFTIGLAGGAWWLSILAFTPGWFPLREIRVQGSDHTDVQEALRVLELNQGINLLSIDPAMVRSRLSVIPWIRQVEVSRVFPGTLVIEMVEKIAVATGKEGDRLVLLDEYGMPIKPLEINDPVVMPIISGIQDEDRAKAIVDIINLLNKHVWLRPEISEAVGLPGGRWMLFTRRGIQLLLSQEANEDLILLQRIQNQHRILDRRVSRIDLRVPGKVFVKPRV
ncbi:MAG: FtsQ-type POTRA domain-containing protein [Magnetococcales bacterium]|nr:FtsQ-type POTRA domain-containing protein [Magnetococcales bacterium]